MFRFLLLLTACLPVASSAECIFDSQGRYLHPDFAELANPTPALQDDTATFWAEQAKGLDWFDPYHTLLEWNPPYARWFEGGTLNVSYNCLDRHLKDKKDLPALMWSNEVGHERIVTYGEMHAEVCKLANVLKNLGVQKGDTVAIYMPLTPEGIASMLACTRIGAVHSVIFGGTGAGSLKEKINDASTKVLITADVSFRKGKNVVYKEIADTILPECPTVEKVIVLQRGDVPCFMMEGRDFSYHDLMAKSSSDCPAEVLQSEDPLFILYTSGSTGKPKGIMHTTAGYLLGTYATFKWVFDYKPGDIYWCTADIGWITGHSYVVYGPMSNGVSQIIYEGAFDYPDKDQAWKIIEKYKPTIFYTAPTLIRTFMKWGEDGPNQYDLSSLRLLGSIGEPINPEAWHWFHRVIGKEKCPIVDTWFQTETGALVITPLPGKTPLTPGSVTKALPGYKVDILDEEGNPTTNGYLAIKEPFPSMLRGVLNDPVRYYKTYWEKWNGKYYYAGDFAHYDANGDIWVRGRADEVIKVSGHRIGTAEVENAIVQVEGVSEAAVIGVSDPLKGQTIVSLVVVKDGKSVDGNKIKEEVGENLGTYAKPEIVAFVPELPKTRSGKILRRVLANLIEGKPVGDITTLENKLCIDELARVCGIISRKLGKTVDLPEQPAKFTQGTSTTLSHEEVIKIAEPIVQNRLAATNYDRMSATEQFIDHVLNCQKENPNVSPLEAYKSFTFQWKRDDRRGGPCVSLTLDLFEHLPADFSAYLVAAKLPTRYQQPFFPHFCHTAILVVCKEGYVLLDPSFDIDKAIWLPFNGPSYKFDMGKKGMWEFSIQGTEIICDIYPVGGKPNNPDPDYLRMHYRTDQIVNPIESSAIPMLVRDRRLSFLSRDEHGFQHAHINVELDKGCILWDEEGVLYEPIPFTAFTKESFPESFCQKLYTTQDELHKRVSYILTNKPILDSIYGALNDKSIK